ncbi:phytanoyl-CoA dioxygenase family protein [Ferrovibrio sp.]|uniref:phytanoyl-CoA dioxygenase family protein n=1 Tax=Ferrovibrio sp. TaxID=1917215 RepID=UPI002635B0A0|nr:phytanoyl-CoA dioxygenase family protein [Ferrovibrio sp.]
MARNTKYNLRDEDIETYYREGVVCLRGVLNHDWIKQLQDAVEEVLANPGPQARADESKGGRNLYDTFMWTRNETFWQLQCESPLPAVTAKLMRSSVSHLLADVLFAKEPNTPVPTPWHQDQPYGWYNGSQTISCWLPLDPVDLSSGALEYVRGSFRDNVWYRPVGFATGEEANAVEFQPMPEIEKNRDKYDIFHFDMEPGDLLIHHLLILHGAPGNDTSSTRRRAIAFRYSGDDATYVERKFGPKPIFPSGLKDGDKFGTDLFPQVWPRTGLLRRFWEN